MDFQFKVVLLNGVRGFLAGFFAVAAAFVIPNISTIRDVGEWLFALTLAGVVGGITGCIQALHKYFTWKTDEKIIAEAQARIDNK